VVFPRKIQVKNILGKEKIVVERNVSVSQFRAFSGATIMRAAAVDDQNHRCVYTSGGFRSCLPIST
jgi:hypothetical protein